LDEGNKGEDSWRMGEDPQNCALGYLVGPSAKRGPIPYPGGSRTDSEGLGIEGKPERRFTGPGRNQRNSVSNRSGDNTAL